MSATATSGASASTAIPAFAIPIIEAYAQALEPPITFIMIGTVFSSMLIPLLMALIYFSTSHSRRQPIFILNVLAILLGLVVGTLSTHLMIRTMLSPLTGVSPTEDFVHNVLYTWESWISEAVLVFRVLVVFNPTNRKAFLALLLAFPLAIKTVRAALLIVFLRQWRQETAHTAVNIILVTKISKTWLAKAEWILEIFDNGYMSALFLWQLSRTGHIFNGASVGRETNESKDSVLTKMKTLFWIASTNFIFPIIFNVTQVILLFVAKNVLLAAYVQMVNVYVCIIATVLATVWSSTSSFKDEHFMPSEKEIPGSDPRQSRLSFSRYPATMHDTTISEENGYPSGSLDTNNQSEKTLAGRLMSP